MVPNQSVVFLSYIEQITTATLALNLRRLTEAIYPCDLKTLRQNETAPKRRLAHGIVLQTKTNILILKYAYQMYMVQFLSSLSPLHVIPFCFFFLFYFVLVKRKLYNRFILKLNRCLKTAIQ